MFLNSVTNCKLCISCDAKYVFKQPKKVSYVKFYAKRKWYGKLQDSYA